MGSPPPAVATYRLQFTSDFGFAAARAVVPYLRALGISHIYASPITRARPGSRHGYDVCDPSRSNPELGSEADLIALLTTVREAGLGWLQDIVPNHLAASVDNPYWFDLLRYGRRSRWAALFDIDWEHPQLDGVIQLPVLPQPYGVCLEQGAIRIAAGATGLEMVSGDLRLPLAPRTAPLLIPPGHDDHAIALALAAVETIADPDRREQAWTHTWDSLTPAVRQRFAAAAAALTGTGIDRVLQAQAWRPAWWRSGRDVVGYRRFFAIDDLVAVRIEEDAAFDLMHALVFRLADAGWITGLRVDHIDGLRDPTAYLARLQTRLPHIPLVVEKILARGEDLPQTWPVVGTTGYDFLAPLVGACSHPRVATWSQRRHNELVGACVDGEALDIRLREQVDQLGLGGDADRVVRCVQAAHRQIPAVRDLSAGCLRTALKVLVARLPVYRTYGTVDDRPLLEQTVVHALRDRPDLGPVVQALAAVLTAGLDPQAPSPVREALLRWQQLTGPVMAKGREDTFFYAYPRWLAANEVGGDPLLPALSPSGFITAMAARGMHRSQTMNATATHDTKRGEDGRARLAALTWMPELWEDLLATVMTDEPHGPHREDQYLLLQTLIASWPANSDPDADYRERMQACARKCLREGGIRSTWTDPEQTYEATVFAWLDARCFVPEGAARLSALIAALRPTAEAISLAMVVLKCTLPGVPDVYQGCEWWDFSMVDPDNRRPVDYSGRIAGLAAGLDGEDAWAEGARPEHRLPPAGDPRRKQAVLARCLHARRTQPALQATVPTALVPVVGDDEGLFAFQRHDARQRLVVVADVRGSARQAQVHLPTLRTGCRWRDLLSGMDHGSPPEISVADLLAVLPCAVLAESGPEQPCLAMDEGSAKEAAGQNAL